MGEESHRLVLSSVAMEVGLESGRETAKAPSSKARAAKMSIVRESTPVAARLCAGR